ncbi:uncharacterized protein L201_002906 [Kwoniella dendrophila CBS 6074]|uniref:tRNA (guanine(9)-N1)-methyltransferase n=1 Tax=Kwoniella dendrophila CBS 6074 TaxID=1295534 RepID=A0AAX4JRX1_9TREE
MDEESMLNASTSMEEPQAGPSTLTSVESGTDKPEGMSKNAMKRLAKEARMAELKPLKRKLEKQRRKERKNELSKGYIEGTLSEKDKELYEKRKQLEKERKIATKKFKSGELDSIPGNNGRIGNNNSVEGNEIWNGGIIIDLGFDKLMNEQEIKSISSQIAYCYSSNRTASKPIKTILHTSFSPEHSPRLWNKMISRNWNKWSRSYWWHQDVGELNEILNSNLEDLKSTSATTIDQIEGNNVNNDNQNVNEQGKRSIEMTEDETQKQLEDYLIGPNLPKGIIKGKHKLIYLSADSEEEIETLDENEIYIIGGIVDRNRYKNLCQNKAENLNIKTARLPIGKFIENLPTRKVLTVNQVFDILLQYIAQKDWQKAFETVIPQRKYHESKKAKSIHNKQINEDQSNESVNNDDDDDADDQEELDEQH